MKDIEQKLIEFAAKTRHDPLNYVKHAYPWGEGQLEGSSGPRKWQEDILGTIGERLQNPVTRHQPIQIAISSGHGIGKILNNNSLVDTPNGKREWGMLEVGDKVFGSNGKPTTITAKYPHKDWKFYKIKFSDGTFVYAGLEHQWCVTTIVDRKTGNNRIVTTEEMMNNLHRRYQIPLCGRVEYPEKKNNVHPYIMGYILGNGNLCTDSAIRISCHDEELYEHIWRLLPDSCSLVGRDETYKHISADGCPGSNLVLNDLVDMGIHKTKGPDKYIPDFYKYNSSEVRIQLLRGLMDSDGTVSPRVGDNGRKGYKVQFSTSSEKLRDDVIWLARSLGGLANYSTDGRPTSKFGDKTCNVRPNYEVHINLPNDINPFHLKRKSDLYDDYINTVKRKPIRVVRSIEFSHIEDGHCITVDAEDHLYLCSNFTVTHNSSLISMVCNWAMSTCVDCRITITANTEPQLRTKTWPEVTKWFKSSITAHWFKDTATSIYSNSPEHERLWRMDAVTWSDTNTQSFAGLHNMGKRLVLIFDESSEISDKIWEVAEGALTDADTEIIWLAFGNPTLNTGRFRACFGTFAHRWIKRQIDSRTVEGTNKEHFDRMVNDYGEDSDYVRVRVKGEFPRSSTMQFIASDLVEAARKRVPESNLFDPLVMGVDVARFGSDKTVIIMRRGRDAVSIPPIMMRGVDLMTTAARVASLYEQHKPDAIFVDGGGVGAGVVDRLRMLRIPVIEVQFGAKADRGYPSVEELPYANKRSEMWGWMKEWFKGGSIPDDPEWAADFVGVQYGYKMIDGRDAIILEKKDDMKKRGLASPDIADALALTFAYAVQPSDHSDRIGRKTSGHQSSYDPLSMDYLKNDLSGSQFKL